MAKENSRVKIRNPHIRIEPVSDGFHINVSYSVKKEKETSSKGMEVYPNSDYKEVELSASSIDEVTKEIKPFLEGFERVSPQEDFLEAFNSDIESATESKKTESKEKEA